MAGAALVIDGKTEVPCQYCEKPFVPRPQDVHTYYSGTILMCPDCNRRLGGPPIG